jgi:hypothetical protein
MLSIDFLSRNDVTTIFPNEDSCIKHLEQLRWNDQVISPFDENSKVYTCKNSKYCCRNSGKYFNVKTNTIFHNSRIPLQKWFIAIWMISARKSKMTSVFLAKEISITQKTAWYMMQRIKAYLEADNGIVKSKKKTRKATVKKEKALVVKVAKPISIETKEPETISLTTVEKEKLKMSEWLLLLKKQ